MTSELILASELMLGIFPRTLWYIILIILAIVLIVLYTRYRKEMNS